MTRLLPRKPFYGLTELCARWSLSEADIAAYVLENELTLSVPVARLRVETSDPEEDRDGRPCSIPTGHRWIIGTMDLERSDAWEVLTLAPRTLSRFRGASGECFDIPDQEGKPGALRVEREALVVRRAEMERFEHEQGIGTLLADAGSDALLRDARVRDGHVRQGSRGAPPKYDWEAFWREVVRIIWEDGPPRTQAELVQRMLDWFAAQLGPDDVPCESSVKRRLSLVWSHFKPDPGRPSALSTVDAVQGTRSPEKTRVAAR
jgi:hypothetical protein